MRCNNAKAIRNGLLPFDNEQMHALSCRTLLIISDCFHLEEMKYEMMTHHLTNALPPRAPKYANHGHLSRARDGGYIGVILAAARGTFAKLRSRINKAVTCKSHIYSSFWIIVISHIWVRFGGANFCGLNSQKSFVGNFKANSFANFFLLSNNG